MSFAHQLVVLVSPSDASATALSEVIGTTAGLAVRDAAVLHGGRAHGIEVTEPTHGWAGRCPLGRRWWAALARAVSGIPNPCSKALIESGVSRSLLVEITESLERGATGVALVAEDVDVESLIHDVERAPSVCVVYGSFPETAIDDLYRTAVGV